MGDGGRVSVNRSMKKIVLVGGIILSIEIKPFESKFFNDLVDLAMETYNTEKMKTPALLGDIDKKYFYKNLQNLIVHGTVNIAVENGDIIGYLGFDKDKSSIAKSATSPLFGYGVRYSNRGNVIGQLFQKTAAVLCESYVNDLWVNVYAHDSDILWMYIMSAFSMDVTDVVRDTGVPVQFKPVAYVFREIDKSTLMNYKHEVIELYRELINHLRVSPVFYHCKYFMPIENRFEDFLSDNIRVFSVFDGNILIGMVSAEYPDRGFAIEDSNAMSLGDLFVAPSYRGQGIASALLNYANSELKKEGTRRIFVTHGTINPNARGFWDKYFSNYSYTMNRKIDPDMLGVLQSV